MNESFLPVITSQELRRIEHVSVKEGNLEASYMFNAGSKIATHAYEWIDSEGIAGKVVLLLGKGNKGGDALVAGIQLLQKGMGVRAVTLSAAKDCSPLQQKFREEFIKAGGVIEELRPTLFSDASIIIDGLLGTGFQGEVTGELAILIRLANNSKKPILAIDVPSGLDGTTGEVRGEAIVADITVTLGALKSGLFYNNSWNYVGEIILEDFGMPSKYLDQAEHVGLFSLREFCQMPPILRNRHKYQAGYVVGFSGNQVFKGAPKLAGVASLLSGAGIVRVFHLDEIGETPYSLIAQKWSRLEWDQEIKRASSVFIGPGIGEEKKSFLKQEIPKIEVPLVCDADAIQKEFDYPPFTILTPHRGELARLFAMTKTVDESELFKKCQEFVEKTHCIIVLKGAPTWIFSKEKKPIVCAGGDPGMAKAGSGDVLTGIIAALLAQKMEPLQAAITGVHLHFLSGEIAASEQGSYSMTAEDLIQNLSRATLEI